MKAWTQMFQTDNAKFQVQRGNGVHIRAADLNNDYVGRGIYRELDRDHEWLFISGVTPVTNGQVEIEYLESSKKQSSTNDATNTTTTEVTEQRVTKHKLTFEPGDLVLITTDPVARPKGRRVTIVTTRTRTEEPLQDE